MTPEKNLTISIFEVTGSPLCAASDDGQKVYDRLAIALNKNLRVNLSFRNVSVLTAAFLNVAVGQLYGEFDETRIRKLLAVEDIEPGDIALLKRVVLNAKQYFQARETF